MERRYRSRCGSEIGFKMIKRIAAIEFVHDFAHLGSRSRWL
jgi:hypothetical protein